MMVIRWVRPLIKLGTWLVDTEPVRGSNGDGFHH